MLPKINGIEVINGIVYWKQPGKYTGIRTYKKYLLMKQKVSPFANTDCHRKDDFGRVWTGIIVREGENPLDAIRNNHVFATTGKINIEFQSDDGSIMGDIVNNDTKRINWFIEGANEIMVYNGDILIERNFNNKGYVKPFMNGPYWIIAKNGSEIAVSSPIWVKGLKSKTHFEKIVGDLYLNKLNKKLNKMLELLFDFEIHDNLWCDYYNWLKLFTLENLEEEDLVGKSFEIEYEQTKRRLTNAIGIARGFMIYLINYHIEIRKNRTTFTKLLSHIVPQHIFHNIMLN
jgi:hypothetical protein